MPRVASGLAHRGAGVLSVGGSSWSAIVRVFVVHAFDRAFTVEGAEDGNSKINSNSKSKSNGNRLHGKSGCTAERADPPVPLFPCIQG
jgi:hypothetical protein